MPAFLESLNERQRAAVCHKDGGALVLAGAGTGKTRVLTSRVAWLTSQCDCPPRAVLAVTFTNKAAKEMRRRVCELVPFPPGDFPPGTFHGVCHRMLRLHAAAAGWDKNFQILDATDQKTFVRRMQTSLGVEQEELPAAECVRYINVHKDRGLRAADIPPESHPDWERKREMYAHYESQCRRENKLDFAELLLSAIDLLRADDNLRAQYAARFRHILIDEFQDTSPLQYRWLRLLDSGDNCFFAVGDDDQSIYAFRGADPENMRRVQTELRAHTVIRLEQNYRSTGNILSAANALIAANQNRLGKTLFTDAGGGAKITAHRADTDIEEAAEIARAVKEKIQTGARADDFAVLYRTNAQSRLLERAMVESGIPYRIYGGTRFFERMEIKHALAYLRLAATDDRDSLLRVMNFPPRGIGKRTMESLAADGDIFSAIADSSAPKVRVFCAILRKLRELREDSSLSDLARAAVEQSGLLAHYESRTEDLERAENLREFVSDAARFAAEFANDNPEADADSLSAFLANAALESGESTGAIGEAVNLLTAHAAKGLEFTVVHIAGLEEGMFPSSQSLDSPDVQAVEEERRLMYVAITRAKKELFLHFADNRMVFGRTETRPRSRFLDELPAELMRGDAEYRPPVPPKPAEDFYAKLYERRKNHAQSRGKNAHSRANAGGKSGNSHGNPQTKSRAESWESAAAAAIAESAAADLSAKSAAAADLAESGADWAADSGGDSAMQNYRPGEIVRHPKHGAGVVLRCKGRGKKRSVQVAFKGIGVKEFVIALSQLTKEG